MVLPNLSRLCATTSSHEDRDRWQRMEIDVDIQRIMNEIQEMMGMGSGEVGIRRMMNDIQPAIQMDHPEVDTQPMIKEWYAGLPDKIRAEIGNWRPPPPINPVILPGRPLYVAIRHSDHRLQLEPPIPVKKILAVRPYYNQHLGYDVFKQNSQQTVGYLEFSLSQLLPQYTRFYFEPEFNVMPSSNDAETVVRATYLSFLKNEIQYVQNQVNAFMRQNNINEAHLVFVVVPDDSDVRDMSVHAEMPTPDNESLLPNVMVMNLDNFVDDAPVPFVAPRRRD